MKATSSPWRHALKIPPWPLSKSVKVMQTSQFFCLSCRDLCIQIGKFSLYPCSKKRQYLERVLFLYQERSITSVWLLIIELKSCLWLNSCKVMYDMKGGGGGRKIFLTLIIKQTRLCVLFVALAQISCSDSPIDRIESSIGHVTFVLLP
jgi:hypothetical protein